MKKLYMGGEAMIIRIIILLTILGFCSCGLAEDEQDNINNGLNKKEETDEQNEEDSEDYDEPCLSEEDCLEKQNRNKSSHIEVLETIKIFNPLKSSESGNNQLLYFTYIPADDSFYMLKSVVFDKYDDSYYPVDSIYCNLSNIEREAVAKIEPKRKHLEGFYKIDNSYMVVGLFEGYSTPTINILSGNSELVLGDLITDNKKIRIYGFSGLHFFYESKGIVHYVQVSESMARYIQVCNMDFNSSDILYDCHMDTDNPKIYGLISGTYFDDHIYILDVSDTTSELKEYTTEAIYTKSYSISAFKKSKKELKNAQIVADLNNIYFVTIEDDYLVFDILQLVHYED